jgi:hypothetical protein
MKGSNLPLVFFKACLVWVFYQKKLSLRVQLNSIANIDINRKYIFIVFCHNMVALVAMVKFLKAI